MRKAIATAGLAAMLSMGIGGAAVAQTNSVAAQVEAEEADDEDSFLEENLGLFGLIGLLGLLGFARGGGGKRSSGGSAYTGAKKGKAPRGGYSSDWSNR